MYKRQIEKLLDQAHRKGLDLRSVRLLSHMEAECHTTPRDLRTLKKLAGARYRITEYEKKGPGYSIKKFLRSPIRVIGAMLIFFIVITQSFFVRTVEILSLIHIWKGKGIVVHVAIVKGYENRLRWQRRAVFHRADELAGRYGSKAVIFEPYEI